MTISPDNQCPSDVGIARWLGFSVLLLALVGFCAAANIAEGKPAEVGKKVLPGHVPAAVRQGLGALGRLSGERRLDFSIGLPLRNREGLTNLLAQIYDPTSPLHHQYLTPEQFAEQFGPTEADYKAVTDFAKANGFRVTGKHSNRMVLSVNGSVADIEKAFHVKMQNYPHPREARTFYAPDAEPFVDSALSVLAISGLDNYAMPKPFAVLKGTDKESLSTSATAMAATPETGAVGSGPMGAYLGKDFRTAYAPGVTLIGAGQSVGLLQFDGYYASDIAAYKKLAGLPDVPVINVLVDGCDGSPGFNNCEVALDIEMAIAMAPGLDRVIVYEEPNPGIPNNVLNRMATDNLAKQLSSSWGNFTVDATTEQIFLQFAAQGQTFFQASGDSGAHVGTVMPPMDNPNITVVGGTTLTTSGAGKGWGQETVWNWYSTGVGPHGSGGGISACYALPSWQAGVGMAANQGSASYRNIPDVAMVADNVWVIYNNGTGGAMGGTSVAAPLWAGFMALVNQQAAANGNPPVGFLNPALYALGKGPQSSLAFHDITSGNNTNTSSPNQFSAAPGYDLCTGWGTPAGSNFINALAPRYIVAAAGFAVVAESCSPANGAVDPGEMVTVSFALQNLSPTPTTNLVAVLQAGNGVVSPSGPQAYGVLTKGGAAVSRSFSFKALGNCGGSITPTLVLQENGQSLGTVTFTLPLGKAVTSIALAETFDGVTGPGVPAGWSVPVVGGGSAWVVSAAAGGSAPQAVYASESAVAGESQLLSPVLTLSSSSAQLSFQASYDTEADPADAAKGYDGGVLEIKIGNGPFTDILAAGGKFVAGGYTRTIEPLDDNPLAGRQVWSGKSCGWKTTIVELPAGVAGQPVQLRWRFGTDTGNGYGGSGWYVDDVRIQETHYDCSSSLRASMAVAPTGTTAYVTFQSETGHTYSVEYKNALSDLQWQPLFANIPGTGDLISLPDTQAPGVCRFYRIIGY